MEIKEKLELFHEAVLQAAGEQSESLLEEYKKSYKENLDAYELQKQKEQETGERIEEASEGMEQTGFGAGASVEKGVS